MKDYICLFSIISILFASCQPDQPSTKEKVVTGNATSITEESAILSGQLNLELTPEMGEVNIGFIISMDSNPGIGNGDIISTQAINNKEFVVTANNLASGTTYYYRSFVHYSGIYQYGAIKTFSTLGITANIKTLDAYEVSVNRAVLKGSIDIKSESHLSTACWFHYCEGEVDINTLKEKGKKVTGLLSSDGSFNANLKDLSSASKYSFVAEARIHDKELCGEVMYFATSIITGSVQTKDSQTIETYKLTLNGLLSTDYPDGNMIKVGFYLSNSASSIDELKEEKEISASLNADKSFSITIGKQDVKYAGPLYYVAHATLYDTQLFGEVKEAFFGPEGYVDMGLKELWAVCNYGASQPEEAGTYISGKDIQSVGNRPSVYAYKDLLSQCDWMWTERSGVNGYKVISRINGNELFFPAAGFADWDSYWMKTEYRGLNEGGMYWTSDGDYNGNWWLFGFDSEQQKNTWENVRDEWSFTLRQVKSYR